MNAPSPARPARGHARKSFARVAAFTLAYTLFVILFGAVVRITGSGAGCGQHWPSCHGDIAHLPRSIETAIELTHRVTSGLALVAVLVLWVVTLRAERPGHPARGYAFAAVAFMIVEALIGAGLVLLELVGQNRSVLRAIVMPAHLVSTYALTAVLTALVAREPVGARIMARLLRSPWVAVSVLGLVAVSATGAVTALGDTVLPPEARSFGARIAEDFGSEASFLTRLRVVHPVLAVLVSAVVVAAARRLAGGAGERARAAAGTVVAAVVAQLVAGVANVLLSAPGWLQVVHLALALAVWIAFVLLIFESAVDARPA